MKALYRRAGRFILAALFVAGSPAGVAWASGAREQSMGPDPSQVAAAVSVDLPGVSVVELFTSEGCSSCPPADGVLASLLAHSRQTGTPIYALAWHVGYWNDLGWRDPYALKTAAVRQQRYASELSSPLYTPEIVVNGTRAASSAGSLRAVERLTTAAQMQPARTAVLIAVQRGAAANELAVRVSTTGAPGGSAVHIALVEDGLVQHPDAGENAGRTLRHDAVVRAFATLPAAGGRVGLAVPPGVRLGRSRVVAFVQTSSLAIVGANEVELGGVVLKAGGPARVSGRLLDRAGGGVNGAQVQACSDKLCLPAATDSSGRFSVTGIPAGRYDLKLFLPKRSANPVVTLPVEVRAGEDISLPPVAVGT